GAAPDAHTLELRMDSSLAVCKEGYEVQCLNRTSKRHAGGSTPNLNARRRQTMPCGVVIRCEP
ncbi:MAG TPA: hypothetical protein VN201_05940, partial [Roseateles sp.]|nr:hypothetical protein [Roseateles sp.]